MIATRFLVFRLLRDRFLLRCPGISHFVKQDLLANFGRVFSTMLRAGLPIQESLQAAHDTCRNEVGRLTITRVQEAVRRGQRITPTLESSGIFPALAYDLCAAGEEAGALDRVFSKLGDYYEQKLQDEAQMLAKFVQPLIIILLASDRRVHRHRVLPDVVSGVAPVAGIRSRQCELRQSGIGYGRIEEGRATCPALLLWRLTLPVD